MDVSSLHNNCQIGFCRRLHLIIATSYVTVKLTVQLIFHFSNFPSDMADVVSLESRQILDHYPEDCLKPVKEDQSWHLSTIYIFESFRK